jgi:hypothetical protein
MFNQSYFSLPESVSTSRHLAPALLDDGKVLDRCEHRSPGIGAELQQILIASNQVIGIRSMAALENMVIVGIAGDDIEVNMWHDKLAEAGEQFSGPECPEFRPSELSCKMRTVSSRICRDSWSL